LVAQLARGLAATGALVLRVTSAGRLPRVVVDGQVAEGFELTGPLVGLSPGLLLQAAVALRGHGLSEAGARGRGRHHGDLDDRDAPRVAHGAVQETIDMGVGLHPVDGSQGAGRRPSLQAWRRDPALRAPRTVVGGRAHGRALRAGRGLPLAAGDLPVVDTQSVHGFLREGGPLRLELTDDV